jgi:PAS domain S-box-containing protein
VSSLLLRCLLLLACCVAGADAWAQGSVSPSSASTPVALDGRLDLSGHDAATQGTAPLAGSWRFHARRFIDPAAPSPAGAQPIAVPGSWNDALGAAAGWGSYELTIDCRPTRGLALLIPAQHSAARWFVNGQPVHQQGRPAEQAADEQPALGTRVVTLGSAGCPLRLVVHLSNHHQARGGMVLAAGLGDETALGILRGRNLAIDFGLVCCFALLGALTLMFHGVRRRESAVLWFGCFCFAAAAYTGLANDRFFERMGLQLPMVAHLRLEYAAALLTAPLLLMLMRRLFPRDLPSRAIRAWVAASTLPLGVLAAPAPVFTAALPLLQWLPPAALAWLLWRLLPTLGRRRHGARAFFAGLLLLAVVLVADNLRFTRHFEWPHATLGMLAFVLAAAAAMSQRLARALTAEELRGLEQSHRANLLVRATKAGILDWDVTTGAVSYSERYRQMLGHASDADTSAWPDFFAQVHADDRETVRAAFMAQLRERSAHGGFREHAPMSYRLMRADGGLLWVQAEAIALVGADGRTLRYICAFVDITPLKNSEQQVTTERERLRLLVRSTKAGFGDWDAVADSVSYTPRFKEMLGYPADFDTAQWPSIFEMMHADDREQARAQFKAMIRRKPEGGEQEPGEPMSYRLQRRDGTHVWIHAEGISQVDEEGRTRRFITSYLDVTPFREQEEALRRQVELTRTEQRRLDLVVRGARVGIVDWDGLTHETWYSPRFREIRGYAPDADTAAWPDYFKVMIHADDRERITRRWVAFIRGKGPEGPLGEFYSPEEYRLLRADGGHVWVQVSGMAVRDGQGFVQRWIAAIIDITERREQAALLERQNEALKENVRLREDMERIGRHDLKTPLNTIIAVPRLLRERNSLAADDAELIGIVERAGLRILNLVNLSLDLFRMEQGSYGLRPQPVDLLEVLHTVVADVRAHADTKHLAIDIQVDGRDPVAGETVHAWAEDLLCYSIFANLVKNAIEAAPEGTCLTVHLRCGEQLELALHNEGAVPEAIRERFFDKYATAGKSDGTGLGTYSAWLMARIQGGALTMQTSPAEGTTLTLTLQRATPAQARAQQQRQSDALQRDAASAEPLPTWRVLAVDDDEFNLLVMRRYLPSPPLTVFTAVNGRAALEQALQCQPELVLIDLDMPVMDGLEATRRLREQQRQGALPAAMRIVMLSSHDDDATRRRALDAGCDHYLCKPVSKEVLLQTLQWAAGRRAEPPPASMAPRSMSSAEATSAEGPAGDLAHDPADPAAVVFDPDLVDRMPAFLSSRRQLLTELEAAAREGRGDDARRNAHRLAGSFSLYGLLWAAAQCRALEKRLAADDVALAALQPALDGLHAHLAGVQSRTAAATTAAAGAA